jgi:hypothetical protein
MDSDAWRPFAPVDVKRQVGRSAATTGRGFVEQLSDEDDIDNHGEDYEFRRRFRFRLQRLHLAGCERGDVHHARNWCRSMNACEDRFPLLGVMAPARFGHREEMARLHQAQVRSCAWLN